MVWPLNLYSVLTPYAGLTLAGKPGHAMHAQYLIAYRSSSILSKTECQISKPKVEGNFLENSVFWSRVETLEIRRMWRQRAGNQTW